MGFDYFAAMLHIHIHFKTLFAYLGMMTMINLNILVSPNNSPYHQHILALRRIFGPITDEVTGGLRKLHNEELRNLYSLPNIIRMIKMRKMRWVGHVA
jgi:hypothetical protein